MKRTQQLHRRGLPRFANEIPPASASLRSSPAFFRASIFSGPLGIDLAVSSASSASATRSRLSKTLATGLSRAGLTPSHLHTFGLEAASVDDLITSEASLIELQQPYTQLTQIVAVRAGWKFPRAEQCVGGLVPHGRSFHVPWHVHRFPVCL